MSKENNELKNVRLEILLSASEKDQLQVLAQKWHLSMGSTIRQLIQREAKRG